MLPVGKFKSLILFVVLLLTVQLTARAIDQAMPGDHQANPHAAMIPPTGTLPSDDTALILAQDRTVFNQQIQLDDFRLLAIQNLDQVKIIDSWARQSLKRICNRETYLGQDPVCTAMDMMLRPEAWNNRNIIFIQAIPIREQLTLFAEGPTEAARHEEAARMMKEGLVSPRFLDRPEVQQKLQAISLDVRQHEAVAKISIALDTLNQLWIHFDIAPPGPTERFAPWHQPAELEANTISPADRIKLKVTPVPGYSAEQAMLIHDADAKLLEGWRNNDVALTNQGLASLAAILPTIDPPAYPSSAKRTTELWYNRTFYGTIANVFLYFIAMVLFLLVALNIVPKLRPLAYGIFTFAVIVHLLSMGIRFWLAGRWPTQNQFESVLGAALLGCIVGWLLETWKKSGLFGMAFSFVGFLAMTACMAAPYMFGTDLGGAISKTAGILQTYWLYIHVNIVISSYALISASFILGAVYLAIRQWHWINPIETGSFSLEESPTAHDAALKAQGAFHTAELQSARSATLATLDQANMVILQLAFWFLGIGIICGAVWADHSWGRPWGWDPKETFALITWLVYLIIVHVRLVIPSAKAPTTALLSCLGFGIMMFNWIGVNFFLAGLHSYA